jgi:hypothetical protein
MIAPDSGQRTLAAKPPAHDGRLAAALGWSAAPQNRHHPPFPALAFTSSPLWEQPKQLDSLPSGR